MYIEGLELHQFRNYDTLSISFDKGVNILYGDNAQGKTNILEAVYIGATTRSHRGAKDKDVISFGKEDAHIRILMKKRDVGHRIDLTVRKNKPKSGEIDGISIRRSAELFGMLPVIFFSPEDLSVVKNGPVGRRRFMDMEICQLSRIYYSNLQTYNKVLDHRNHLLKDMQYKHNLSDMLDVLDIQLVKAGTDIIRERENFLLMMNEIIAGIHSELTDGKEEIYLKYEKSTDEESFEKTLKEKRKMEIRHGTTEIGPHRDDFAVFVNGIDVRTYGSQGQQRTAALSLKLSEIELIRKVLNDDPVLLLDDVMSELDSRRRESLVRRLGGIQTIITCTGYDDFISREKGRSRIYRVNSGKVEEEANG